MIMNVPCRYMDCTAGTCILRRRYSRSSIGGSPQGFRALGAFIAAIVMSGLVSAVADNMTAILFVGMLALGVVIISKSDSFMLRLSFSEIHWGLKRHSSINLYNHSDCLHSLSVQALSCAYV